MNPIAAIRSHPVLMAALVLALATAAGLWSIPNHLTGGARALIAWDVLAGGFCLLLLWMKRAATPQSMARAAAQQDEGRYVILLICLAAAAAAIYAVAQELMAAKTATDGAKQAHILFAFFTVACSWSFVHLMFASHYAHEFYAPDDDGEGTREGLIFPGQEEPDFGDFLHFALVIGVANQTADVQISSKHIRRTVTLQGIVAFLFNTVVLALSINFAASLFA